MFLIKNCLIKLVTFTGKNDQEDKINKIKIASQLLIGVLSIINDDVYPIILKTANSLNELDYR